MIVNGSYDKSRYARSTGSLTQPGPTQCTGINWQPWVSGPKYQARILEFTRGTNPKTIRVQTRMKPTKKKRYPTIYNRTGLIKRYCPPEGEYYEVYILHKGQEILLSDFIQATPIKPNSPID